MISIQSYVNKELENRPFYSSLLYNDMLNTTTFAQQIQPKIESQIQKPVSIPTLVTCLARAKKTIGKPKIQQKIHSIKINYPLVWATFGKLNEESKDQILSKLPNLHSYYENRDNMTITFKEKTDITIPKIKGVKDLVIGGICELVLEYHDQYHSQTGLFYEIAREFYWQNITIIDQANNDHLVWVYIYDRDIAKALEVLRSKFVVVGSDMEAV